MRFYLALILSKLTYFLIRLLGKDGTFFPGVVALKVCPKFIEKINKPKNIICITGTDGKTTTTNIITDVLLNLNHTVCTNRLGANINSGVATTLTNSVNLFNKQNNEYAVLEVDEHYVRILIPVLKPNYLVVTNLIRDSLKRNAHSEYVFNKINSCDYKDMTVILNADDLCSSFLLKDNKRIFYGIDKLKNDLKESKNIINDYKYCPKCNKRLKADYVRYCHIGKYSCDCGFKSFNYDTFITKINKNTILLNDNLTYPILNDGIFNIYNELAVITLFKDMNINYGDLCKALNKSSITKTRYSYNKVNGIKIYKTMIKGNNSIPASLLFDYISRKKDNLIIIFNPDDYTDYNEIEFNGWIYDTDFEFLNKKNIKQIIIAGKRCYDNKLRFLLAGIDNKKLVCLPNEEEAINKINLRGIDSIYILHDMSSYKESMKAEEIVNSIIKERLS